MDSDSEYSINGERKEFKKKYLEKRQRKRILMSKSRNKKWTKEEHLAYCQFLKENANIFENTE